MKHLLVALQKVRTLQKLKMVGTKIEWKCRIYEKLGETPFKSELNLITAAVGPEGKQFSSFKMKQKGAFKKEKCPASEDIYSF